MPTANPTGQMLGAGRCGLLSPPCGSSSEPSSLSSAASLRDELQRRVAHGVNDATIAASSLSGERLAHGAVLGKRSSRLRGRAKLRVGEMLHEDALVALSLEGKNLQAAPLLHALHGRPEVSRPGKVAASELVQQPR